MTEPLFSTRWYPDVAPGMLSLAGECARYYTSPEKFVPNLPRPLGTDARNQQQDYYCLFRDVIYKIWQDRQLAHVFQPLEAGLTGWRLLGRYFISPQELLETVGMVCPQLAEHDLRQLEPYIRKLTPRQSMSLRGGSWANTERRLRVSNRLGSFPNSRNHNFGFRVSLHTERIATNSGFTL
ncbi:MAG: hypothetical protein HQM12_20310 [SAR324 cluster bacterium]|nr:hypothetical protein [SAR324 cluster bacterium]